MNTIQNIGNFNLILAYLLLLIPIAAFGYYKTGLIKATVIAYVRMTVQLFLLGIYLKWIFKLNNPWLNILWLLLMVLVAALTIASRTKLTKKMFIIPFFVSVLITIAIIDIYFLKLVIALDNILNARYFVPISGMILGNFLKTNIIALNHFYSSLKKELTLYKFLIGNGATREEALRRFIGEAIKIAFNPSIANAAVMGLIALPGMMTGQLLSGSLPIIAIKYQIMIVITIFVGSMLSVLITFAILNRSFFDKFDMPKELN